ncbi:MAG: MFS transporter [Euryarchaeota archaeon]|nr:MFS transporter [Euryarchaeota archaeon]
MFYKFSAYGFLKNLRLFEPFLILFFLSSGLSYTDIGILYATAEISTNLAEIPTGIYADIFGRRKSMLMGFGAYLVTFSLFYLTSNFYVFLVAMVLYGIGDAFRSGTHKAMILEYLKIKNMMDKKVEYYGSTRAASQFGSAINSLLAGLIVFYTGDYHLIFLITIIPYVADFINLATYPKELDGDIIKNKRRDFRKQVRATFSDFAAMFKNKFAFKALLNSAVFDAGFKSSKDYLQPILQSFALSLPVLLYMSGDERTAIVVGIVYFFLYLLSSYASKKAHVVVKKVKNIVFAINIIFVLGTLFIMFAGLAYAFELFLLSIVLFISLHVLFNMRRPMNVSYVSDKISSRVMASGLSVESQMKMIFSATFSFLIGFFADKFGVGHALFIVGMLILIIFPLAYLREE